MKVICVDGKFEQAMRKFKKKVADSGILQDLRDRECYVKPSIARKIAKGKAKNRWNKYLASQELPKKMY
jgi:small subunit ribosomal protein S21